MNKKSELRHYQTELIEKLKKNTSNNKYICIPHGVGKTMTMVNYISQIYQKKNILIVCEYKNDMEKYAKYFNIFLSRKEILCYTNDVIQFTTSGAGDLFLNDKFKRRGKILLITYDNLLKTSNFKFDLAIYNNASKLLNNDNIKFIGPEYEVNEKIYITPFLINHEENKIFDNNIFNNNIYNYTYKQAISDNFLLDYSFECHTVDDNEKSNYVINLIKNKIVNNECKKIAVFFQTINESTIFEKALNEYFKNNNMDINVFNVNSKKNNNDDLLLNFRTSQKPSILCNIGMLYTLNKMSFIDCVIFYDKDKSINNIAKDISICLKLHENKSIANIVMIIDNYNKNPGDHYYVTNIILKMLLENDDSKFFDKIIINDNKTKNLIHDYFLLKNFMSEKDIIEIYDNNIKQNINDKLKILLSDNKISEDEYIKLLLFVSGLNYNPDYDDELIGPVTFREHYDIIKFIRNKNIQHVFYDHIFFFKESDEIIKSIKGEIQVEDSMQYKAIYKIFNFLRSYNNEYFTLFGFSGSGKTAIISSLINFLVKKMFIHNIIFATPTNTAHNIIESNFSKNKRYDQMKKHVKFMTIHNALDRIRKNGPNDKIKFIRNNNNTIQNYDVIIIDECSMLANDIINEIKEKHNRTKIIYCGDPAQLPPVGEKDNDIVKEYNSNRKHMFELTCNIRQKNNIEFKTMFENIRKWVFNDKSSINDLHNILKKCKSNNIKLFRFKNLNNFVSSYINKIVLGDDSESNILIGYNKCSKIKYCNYIDVIKKQLFPHSSNKYNKNEPIIFKKPITIQIEQNNNNNKKNFYVNSRAKIVEVGNMFRYNLTPIYINNNLRKELKNMQYLFPDCQKIIMDIKMNINNSFESINYIIRNSDFDAYNISIIEYNNNNDNHDTNKYPMIVIDKDQKYIFDDFQKNISNKFDDLIQEITMTSANVIKNNNIIKLINQIQYILFKNVGDIESYYYITTHSAQGLSIENVYVDLYNINSMSNYYEKKKCMYTALSRAKNKLYVLY